MQLKIWYCAQNNCGVKVIVSVEGVIVWILVDDFKFIHHMVSEVF